METQPYNAGKEQIGRVERSLCNLNRLVMIDNDFARGKISYSEIIEDLMALSDNPGIRIPVLIRPEAQIKIPINSQ